MIPKELNWIRIPIIHFCNMLCLTCVLHFDSPFWSEPLNARKTSAGNGFFSLMSTGSPCAFGSLCLAKAERALLLVERGAFKGRLLLADFLASSEACATSLCSSSTSSVLTIAASACNGFLSLSNHSWSCVTVCTIADPASPLAVSTSSGSVLTVALLASAILPAASLSWNKIHTSY